MLRDLRLSLCLIAIAGFNLAASQQPSQGLPGDLNNHWIYPANSSAPSANLNFVLGQVVTLKWITDLGDYIIRLNQIGTPNIPGPMIINRNGPSTNGPFSLTWQVMIGDLSLKDGTTFSLEVQGLPPFNSQNFNIIENSSSLPSTSPTTSETSPSPSITSSSSVLTSVSAPLTTNALISAPNSAPVSGPSTTNAVVTTPTSAPATPTLEASNLAPDSPLPTTSFPSSYTPPAPLTRQASTGLSTATKIGMGAGLGAGLTTLFLLGAFYIIVAKAPLSQRRAWRTSINELVGRRVESTHPTRVNSIMPLDELLAQNQRLRQDYLHERHELDGDWRWRVELPVEMPESPVTPVELVGSGVRVESGVMGPFGLQGREDRFQDQERRSQNWEYRF